MKSTVFGPAILVRPGVQPSKCARILDQLVYLSHDPSVQTALESGKITEAVYEFLSTSAYRFHGETLLRFCEEPSYDVLGAYLSRKTCLAH